MLAAVMLAAAGWLVWTCCGIAMRPLSALDLLRRTATSHRINIIGQVPRLLAGAAMMVRADVSRFTLSFIIAGLSLMASSVALLIVPLCWHNGYAVFWARRISPLAVRGLASFSMLGGIGLIWAA